MVRLFSALVIAMALFVIPNGSTATAGSPSAQNSTGVKLYAVATSSFFARLCLEEGSGNKRIFVIPKNGKAVSVQIGNVYGKFDPTMVTQMELSIGTTDDSVGNKVMAAVIYDFAGDGSNATFVEFPEMEIAPIFAPQLYAPSPESARVGVRPMADLKGGKITLWVWNTGGVSDLILRTDSRSFEEQQSFITVPYNDLNIGSKTYLAIASFRN